MIFMRRPVLHFRPAGLLGMVAIWYATVGAQMSHHSCHVHNVHPLNSLLTTCHGTPQTVLEESKDNSSASDTCPVCVFLSQFQADHVGQTHWAAAGDVVRRDCACPAVFVERARLFAVGSRAPPFRA